MTTAGFVPDTESVSGLDVCISAEGDCMVIALRGEADVAALPTLMDVLASAISDWDGAVVVDLATTDFIDTANAER